MSSPLIAQKSNFFLVIPPGFENLAAREVASFSYDINKGGIELETSLEKGLALNHDLKIPTRILLRLAQFKCRDFPKLFNKIKKIPWRYWLWNEKITPHITSSHSRLIHTTRIEKALQKGVKASLKAAPFKKRHFNPLISPPEIYLRIHEDKVQVSIDTSYPHLYFRGGKKSPHPASLRENLAYGCWLQLKEYLPLGHEKIMITDPMCGSGTFLTEISPPPRERVFSYQFFPILPPNFLPQQMPLSSHHELFLLEGKDKEKKLITNHQKDFPHIKWQVQDLFEASPSGFFKNDYKRVIISNPPYNRRLKISKNHLEIFRAMIKNYRPHFIGLILPKDMANNITDPRYEPIAHINFRNGGFPCQFKIWKKNSPPS